MHTVDIYRAGILYVSVKPDDSSVQTKKIMGENELRLDFELNFEASFSINDYADVFGERYILLSLPIVNKLSKFLYQYTLTLKAEGFTLARAQYLFYGEDNTLKETDFSLLGTAEDFLNLIVDNANRVSTGWSKGQVIINGYKNMTFSMENCYNALGRVSEEFGTEFFIDGKIIHLTKRQRNTPYRFRHGKSRGLYEIKRISVDSTDVITRLYAYGAGQNLPENYRNFSSRLKMTGGVSFVEKNVSKYGLIEATQIFEDIYPTRVGKVTSADASNIFKFNDATIDFDVNTQLLQGTSAKVTFNTGDLAGYTFELASFQFGSRQFTIIKNKDEKAFEVPSTDLRPRIGDEYVLVDIKMPQSYIDAAEAKLTVAANKLLAVNSEPLVTYSVILDPVFIQINNITLSIGDLVYLDDVELQISRSIRIVSTVRNIIEESEIQVELADLVVTSPFTAVVQGVQTNSRDIEQIGQQLQNTLNNRVVGDLTIEQGSVVAPNMPTTTTLTGFSDIVIDNATGRLYRKG